MRKQRCDICGKRYGIVEGMFTYKGISKDKWRKLSSDKQKGTEWGETATCKHCRGGK